MANQRGIRVIDAEGTLMRLENAADIGAGSDGQVALLLDDGQRVLVPGNLLQRREDGTYYLPLPVRQLREQADRQDVGRLADEETVVVPVIEERLDVHKQAVSRPVRVRKLVHEHEEVIDEPLLHEDVVVERVPVGRRVDGPVPVRYEGDTMIVPLLEEVLVVEKRVMLREELHITRRRTETHEAQRATLRTEEVLVERQDPPGDALDRANERAAD